MPRKIIRLQREARAAAIAAGKPFITDSPALAGLLMSRGFELLRSDVSRDERAGLFAFPPQARAVAEQLKSTPAQFNQMPTRALPRMRGGGGRRAAPTSWEPRA